MNQLGLAIHTDMRLHAEVPLVALLGLMHLGIPLFLPILCRTGRTDDGGINEGPPADLQPVGGQICTDSRKELFPQLVRFQQMPKLADRRLIRDRFATQINAHKLPHGARVIQRVLHGRIREIEPLLQTVEA